MDIKMPENVKTVIEALENAGYEAYAVGGCVRDAILGKLPNDWDIATSAKPEQMKELFKGYHCVETGIEHGTLTVVLDSPLEITTFRLDGEYEDNRHPKSVDFTAELSLDLARRDFTVNAMARNLNGEIIDPYGGRADIKKKLIRCVGDPDKRFNEDALRILRGLRFASTLDFEIEEKTAESIRKNKDLIKNISVERVSKELLKLICGKGAYRILKEFAEVIFVIIPELEPMYKNPHDSKYHCYDIYEHSLYVLDNVSADPLMRFSALLHDCGKPMAKQYSSDGQAHYKGHQHISAQLAQQVMQRLKLPNKFRDEALFIIENHDRWELYERADKMKKFLSEFGEQRVFELLEIMRADSLSQSPRYYSRIKTIDEARQKAEQIMKTKPCLSRNLLAVNGKDLIEIGIPKGKALGFVLSALLDEVIDGKIKNRSEDLIQRAKQIYEMRSGGCI